MNALLISPQNIANHTIGTVLDEAARLTPLAPAIVAVDGRLSFGEFDDAVNRAANALLGLGVTTGERVAFSAPNVLASAVSLFATARIGAIWVGIGPHLAPAEVVHMLADSGSSVLVAEERVVGDVHAARTSLDTLRCLIGVDLPDGGWSDLTAAASTGRPTVEVGPEDVAAIAYTSGTTGFPKGAMHIHRSLLLQGSVLASTRNYNSSTRFGLATSMMNLMGPMLSTLTMAQVGGCVVLIDRMQASRVSDWVHDERITDMPAVGALVHDLASLPHLDSNTLSSLRDVLAGAGDIAPTIIDRFSAATGVVPSVGYGQTEVPGTATLSGVNEPRTSGSSGRALPHVEVAILDTNGNPLTAGDEGEICVRAAKSGPWAGMYQPLVGYWNRPADTASALRGGWLHTGDLGRLNPNGELFVSGRVSAMIVRGGANVYPAEVERVLVADELIFAAVVVGVPDQRLGERVVALIEVGRLDFDTEGCMARCRQALAWFKCPENVIVVETLPRNGLGKIIRPAALALAIEALEQEPESDVRRPRRNGHDHP